MWERVYPATSRGMKPFPHANRLGANHRTQVARLPRNKQWRDQPVTYRVAGG